LVELGDPNDPWMMMKGKYRRNIKKSIRDGCKIEILDHGNEAVSRFYKVMEEVFARTKYVMYGKEYFDNVWDSLVVDKLAKIYIATKDGVDVGAYLVTFDNEYAYEFYGGVTDGGRDVEAGYLLKWESIKDAKSMGKKYYDHWGIAPFKDNDYEKGHELYNISKFKEGFGGIKVEYAKQHIVVFNKFSYLIYKVGLGVNGLVLAIKKLI
jgi:lipid II:glycine glycyltransferase (peptidoglycan interpeptide bridge formation enzyme)